MSLIVYAPAKLNLSLKICGKNANNYHELQSLVCFTQFGDTLEIQHAEDFSFHKSSPITLKVISEWALPDDFYSNNLILKCANSLLNIAPEGFVPPPTCIILHKNIPLGAGLGGGSADAAAALKALNDFWKIGATDSQLYHIACEFGSDIAACLSSQPQWMEGTGNQLSPVTLPNIGYILLAFLNIHLGAKDVYAKVTPPYAERMVLPHSLGVSDLDEWLHRYGNDLQVAAISIVPEIDVLLQAMLRCKGAKHARMSGSGSACFALFNTEVDANAAMESLQKQFGDYWFTVTHTKKK